MESYTHIAWRSMKQRCYTTKGKDYPRYGGRGITVCNKWKTSYRAFLTDMGERPFGLTLERDDVDGNYNKENCTWATPKDQANNRRNTRIVMYKGEACRLVELCEQMKFNANTLRSRIRAGWKEVDWFKQAWAFGGKYATDRVNI